VNGDEYTGSYLALLVATNPNKLVAEAAETPQLVCELGRIVALAYREKANAEVDYRVWRDSVVHALTNDLDAAIEAGFACAGAPGVDAKGNAKPGKIPSVTAVESYVRTLPEYREHHRKMAEREEAWATIHAALDAAKARTWAVRALADTEGATASVGDNPRSRIVADQTPAPAIDRVDATGAAQAGPPPPPVRRSK
jgi:hypothetical protein